MIARGYPGIVDEAEMPQVWDVQPAALVVLAEMDVSGLGKAHQAVARMSEHRVVKEDEALRQVLDIHLENSRRNAVSVDGLKV